MICCHTSKIEAKPCKAESAPVAQIQVAAAAQ
jgi:hypothetical protein